MRISVYIVIFILLGLAGCSQNESKESELALIKKTDPNPVLIDENTEGNLDLVTNIKEEIASYKEIYDVAVVKGKKDTLVVYKVKHLQRFHMKKIEKKIKGRLDKKFPDEKFTVSSDYKIFLEAVKLNEKMQNPDYSEKKANKRLKEIIELKNEMA
ncbi:YhcN/YlaJ family sporulation lipoprotein [Cytobacillus solani]|uniref:Sporulation protein n=1 Tax=Cytobacillus solani TaxID=1637975 RepID=A0A0Q3QLU6_9BACI|nr:YhcN/YlaJ family sporulation lipoprotein [Cytobacillus solani]KOP81765.1 sporulation protein [Bacillus sp. FJAT-21945]KQL18702.1 sporulation protein [Cytobacillus solani]USK56685.1 YhcN/YlaJ family sporulation lipoprotein [Cytobacillus solani]